ncbi:DUF4880 domain-containing protein [Sphingomonas gei]|uniref:DUF4880 domain-containing protein n=1 Tax=Sphingomonas gei TaxID=1395960 RepID=A0A4S1X0D2_9SPHN|nr:FecR domain-containing protein [Sphingomonas gei]TGX49113.1 DUF4880 domain-containing protein [Sphingomonas gei]
MADPACNDNPDNSSEKIDREASSWLIRLDDDRDDMALREAFNVWVTSDPRHAAAWQETLRIAGTIALVQHNVPVPAQAAVALRSGTGRLKRWQGAWSGVAAVAIASCAAWLMLPDALIALRADHLTATAEVKTITLPDGSNVTLAPSSAISVLIAGGRRDVHLLRGEAYFDVVHDVNRPFRVLAGESETRVLGTAFDVTLTDSAAGVAVSRGAVQVSLPARAGNAREMLPAGESVSVDWQGSVRREHVRPDRVAAWRQGRIIVADESVSEVIAALRPWYRGYILARGPGLESRRVTGLYDLRDPDAALVALARAQRIEVRNLSPWLKVVTVE